MSSDSTSISCKVGDHLHGLTTLTPFLAAIDTHDEDGHRLIRGTRLEFIVGTFTLATTATLKLISRATLVAL